MIVCIRLHLQIKDFFAKCYVTCKECQRIAAVKVNATAGLAHLARVCSSGFLQTKNLETIQLRKGSPVVQGGREKLRTYDLISFSV